MLFRSPEGRSDAISWIKIGSFYFQPSELLKIGFMITFSVHLDYIKHDINKFKNVILLGIHAFIAVALVILTGDLGSALVFMVMTIGMLFSAGLYLRYFLFGAGAVALVAPILWFEFFSDFQKQRFLAIYSPSSLTEATYDEVIFQQQQGVNAIGSGKILGQGLFEGTYTQNGLVPESRNDMIFTVVGEELGLVGAVGLLVVFFMLMLFCIKVAKNSPNRFGCYLVIGIISLISVQVLVNVAVVSASIPPTGLPLPFISAGSTSLVVLMSAIGVVLNVNKQRIK